MSMADKIKQLKKKELEVNILKLEVEVDKRIEEIEKLNVNITKQKEEMKKLEE
jgi:hypothetical protein